MDYNYCLVSFEVPSWFPPERLDWSYAVRYDKYHAWAGSYSHTNHGNSAEDALFKLKGMKEFCSYSYCMVEFHCEPEKLPKEIREYEKKLQRFFNRYKEAKDQ